MSTDTYIGFKDLCFNRTKSNTPLIPVSRTTIERLVARDKFPKPICLGNRKLWKQSDVVQFLEQQQDTSNISA